jgi:hypothetical protein
MVSISRNISRACGKMSNEADVRHPIRVFMREADVIHRATSGYSRVLCDTSSWSDRYLVVY